MKPFILKILMSLLCISLPLLVCNWTRMVFTSEPLRTSDAWLEAGLVISLCLNVSWGSIWGWCYMRGIEVTWRSILAFAVANSILAFVAYFYFLLSTGC
jgi:hypothetical protein